MSCIYEQLRMGIELMGSAKRGIIYPETCKLYKKYFLMKITEFHSQFLRETTGHTNPLFNLINNVN